MRLKKGILCGPLCDLRVSVVSVFSCNFTTETQRSHRGAQREVLPDRPRHGYPSKFQKFSVRFFLAILTLILASHVCFSQNTPQVLKVEPPGWWAGHSINPMRVLIRGKNFFDAKVQIDGAGISATDA